MGTQGPQREVSLVQTVQGHVDQETARVWGATHTSSHSTQVPCCWDLAGAD